VVVVSVRTHDRAHPPTVDEVSSPTTQRLLSTSYVEPSRLKVPLLTAWSRRIIRR
jgi:hypothetical protein